MIGSLFSGIGGLELGLERALGWPVAWQVEQDEYCRRVLARHWPEAARFDDVRTVGAAQLSWVSLVCGGFPCQDVSGAGLGRGIAPGTRSGLWIEFDRIVGELSPEWIVVENVASGAGRWLSRVRHDLRARGYGTRAYAISAADVGAPHLRRRIFVVGHADRVGRAARAADPRSGAGARESHGGSGRGALANAHGVGLRDAAGHRAGSAAESHDAGAAVAHADGDGRERVAALGLPRSGQQHDAHGRHAWPPRRGDGPGWAVWAGPQPGVRRGPDGLSRRLDRARLRALGNAVVPQCAEVIGRIILGALNP